jgi:hypothetical protein
MYSIDVYAKSIIGMTRFIEIFDFFISPIAFDDSEKKDLLLSQIKTQHGELIKEVIDRIMYRYNLKNIYNKFGIHNKAIIEILNNDIFSNYIVNEYLDDDKIKELDSKTLEDLLKQSKNDDYIDFNDFIFFVGKEYDLDKKTEDSIEKVLKRYNEKR